MQNQGNGRKIHYLTNVKIFLTCLVVVHHASQSYSMTDNNWPIKDGSSTSIISFFFDYFSSVNNSYFMALFFLISGIFVPPSLRRHGAKRALRIKFAHLVVPSLAFLLIVFPAFFSLMNPSGINPFEYLRDEYFRFPNGDMTFGHTWYLVDLFAFVCVFLVANCVTGKQKDPFRQVTPLRVGFLCAFLSLGTFVCRCLFSPGYWLPLHVAEPARVIQYFVFFWIGANKDRFREVARSRYAFVGAIVASAALILGGPVIVLLVLQNKDMWAAGFGWKSLVVSAWECCLGLSVSGALLMGARKYFNASGKITATLGDASFGAYLIHPFVLVLLQAGINGLMLPIPIKFALSSIAAIAVSYIIIAAVKGVIKNAAGSRL